jgi:hypothetical protein
MPEPIKLPGSDAVQSGTRTGDVQDKSTGRRLPLQRTQARIAYALLAIFAATVGMGFAGLASHWANAKTMKDFLTLFIPSEVGLLGAVTGFYFASKTASDAAAQSDSSDGPADPPGDPAGG